MAEISENRMNFNERHPDIVDTLGDSDIIVFGKRKVYIDDERDVERYVYDSLFDNDSLIDVLNFLYPDVKVSFLNRNLQISTDNNNVQYSLNAIRNKVTDIVVINAENGIDDIKKKCMEMFEKVIKKSQAQLKQMEVFYAKL